MDAPAAAPALGDIVRTILSSPWGSSLALLNALVITAGAVALAMPGAITTNDLLLGMLLAAYLVVLWFRCVRHPKDLIEMDTMFLLFFGIYVVLPIVAMVMWQVFGDAPVFVDLVTHFDDAPLVTIAVAALGAFILGYVSPLGRAVAGLMPHSDGTWRRNEGLAISGGLLVLGALLVGILVGSVGLETLTESDYARGYEATAGLGVLAGGVMLAQIGVVVLYLTMASPNRRAPVLPLILFALLALLMLRTGRRRVVLETGLALLAAHHFYVRRVRFRTLAVAAAVSLLVFSVVGLARSYLAEGLGGIVTRITDEFGLGALVSMMSEPIAVLLALTETMYQVPGQESFWLGKSFVEAFELLVPLPLNPNRPLAPSQWFVNLIDPVVARAGGGYSYALLAEGYLNFGIPGAVAVSFLEGVVVRGAVTYRSLFPSSKTRVLVYAVAMSLTVMMIRGDFATLLKAGIVSSLVPAVLTAVWLGRRKPHRTSVIDSSAGDMRVARPSIEYS
jgi:hypothetical protein